MWWKYFREPGFSWVILTTTTTDQLHWCEFKCSIHSAWVLHFFIFIWDSRWTSNCYYYLLLENRRMKTLGGTIMYWSSCMINLYLSIWVLLTKSYGWLQQHARSNLTQVNLPNRDSSLANCKTLLHENWSCSRQLPAWWMNVVSAEERKGLL